MHVAVLLRNAVCVLHPCRLCKQLLKEVEAVRHESDDSMQKKLREVRPRRAFLQSFVSPVRAWRCVLVGVSRRGRVAHRCNGKRRTWR
jgi:hypothetical protein